ncbi:MAG: TIGR02300 family protein [Rickettsiales bacterium]|jgi:uncharacterized protein (TIGR02300 family)|nr:TIGR02300 family protein [Rickettsiales bacterium]
MDNVKGKKRICPDCGSAFYDMNRPDIVCPKCRKGFREDEEIEFIRSKKRTAAKEAPADPVDSAAADDEMEYGDDPAEVQELFKPDEE